MLRALAVVLFAAVVTISGCGSTSTGTPRYNNRGLDSESRAGATSGNREKGGPGSLTSESQFPLGVRVDPEDLGKSRFGGDYGELAKWVSAQGWNHITVYAVQPTDSPDEPAKFYFPDVTFSDGTKLSEKGFAQGPSFAKLMETALTLNVTVDADLTRLALSLKSSTLTPQPLPGEELTADQVGEICTTLCRDLKVDRVSGSFFPADWAAAADTACRAAQKQFISGDGLAQASALLTSSSGLALFARSADELAFQALSFAAAGQEKQDAWAGVAFGHDYEAGSPFAAAWKSQQTAQNALKFDAIVAQPTGFLLDVPLDKIETVPGDLLQSLREFSLIKRERKTCNLIFAGNPDTGRPQVAAAVNGILSAGFGLAVSREPMDAADAFYIIAYPQVTDGKVVDLPEGVVKLLGDQKRRVFIQVGGPLPKQGSATGWDALRRACGLDNTDFDALASAPATATMEGQTFPWGVSAGGKGAWGTRIAATNVSPSAVALVLGSETTDGAAAEPGLVLMTISEVGQGGATVFVNGAALDIQAAYPISNILAAKAGLQAPTTALVTVSDAISAFFAANGDTEVKIRLAGADGPVTTKSLKEGQLEVIKAEPPRAGEQNGPAPRGAAATGLPAPSKS